MPHNLKIITMTALLTVTILFPGMVSANVTVQGLFSNSMVLQQGMPVPVWVKGAANEKVTVSINGQEATATTGADLNWMVKLPSMNAGGPYTLTITGSNTIAISDVYIGEVWLCSGQSNMGYTMQCGYAGCAMNNAAVEIAAANYPLIRTCNINGALSKSPQTTYTGSWMVCNPANAPKFSAAAYFFGRELHNNLNKVPIGLVHSSAGGSCMQAFISRADLVAGGFSSQVTSYESGNPSYSSNHDPYIIFNGKINPLVPFAFRGAIWYQGESVTWGSDTYRNLQTLLITSWRKLFTPTLSFFIVQLPNYNIGGGWMPLREAQLQATQILPNTGLAVTIDIGDINYVHPGNKQDCGLRLGLAALGVTYKQDITFSGPIYDHMAVESNSIRLYFKHTDGGLQLNSATATGTTEPFEISANGTTYSTATAKIDQDTTVLVSSASVTSPKTARYCWAANPKASLYNKGTPTSLPASPFRTDAPAFTPVTTAAGSHDAPSQNAGLSVARTGVSGLPITISFKLPGVFAQSVRLRLFDLHGRLVATLLNGVVSAGDHEITFNGIDGQGRILTAGLYVCEMSAGLQSTIHQTALLKVR
jgi:sialate O-acetylesterase